MDQRHEFQIVGGEAVQVREDRGHLSKPFRAEQLVVADDLDRGRCRILLARSKRVGVVVGDDETDHSGLANEADGAGGPIQMRVYGAGRLGQAD